MKQKLYTTINEFKESLKINENNDLPKSKIPKEIKITFGDWIPGRGAVTRTITIVNMGTKKDSDGQIYTKLMNKVPFAVSEDRAREIKGHASSGIMSKFGEDNWIDSELTKDEYGYYDFIFKIKEDY